MALNQCLRKANIMACSSKNNISISMFNRSSEVSKLKKTASSVGGVTGGGYCWIFFYSLMEIFSSECFNSPQSQCLQYTTVSTPVSSLVALVELSSYYFFPNVQSHAEKKIFIHSFTCHTHNELSYIYRTYELGYHMLVKWLHTLLGQWLKWVLYNNKGLQRAALC